MTMIRDGKGDVITPENPLNTNMTTGEIIPVDVQARMSQTIQTHSGAIVAQSTSSDSAWIDTDGFGEIAITMLNSASTTSAVSLLWSNDGVSKQGEDIILTSNTQNRRAGATSTKARYVIVQIQNGNTVPNTFNAWAYLKV